jgi:ubiquinone/menaquinone biosynthesis C-methylase UbiE
MKWISALHETRVHTRRVRVLAEAASRMVPHKSRLLDVGCGDGLFATVLSELRPDLAIQGAEIAPRPGCRIPVIPFDGLQLPFSDAEFDACMLIDVLHHTRTPGTLLREAARVARSHVLLKDHIREGFAARSCLRFMDEVSNRRHGVALPFNYLDSTEWNRIFADCGLEVAQKDPLPGIYPFPANFVFGRRLHFMALLQKTVH